MNTERDPRVNIGQTAILVVDMINDYLSPDGKIICEQGRNIVQPINSILAFCRLNGGSVVFCNTEIKDGSEPIARRWGIHAEAGKFASKVYDKLDVASSDVSMPKTSYNAFFQTELEHMLRGKSIRHVVVVGIHTHVCVLLTSAAAYDLGFDVIVLEDCMTTGYRANHESRLRFFSTHIGTLSNSAEFIKVNSN